MITHFLLAFSPFSWILFSFLALVGLAGVIGVVSPNKFSAVCRGSAHWVDTKRTLEKLDRSIDIDGVALKHSRILGAAVIASVIVLGYLYCSYAI